MTRLWLFLVLLAPTVQAQRRDTPDRFSPPDIFDTHPTALDRAHFRLILENDRVEVIRVRLGPHEKTMVMEIPAHVMTCLTDQHVRLIYAHTKPAERRHKAGDTLWVDQDEYGIENFGDKPVEWVLVVPKSDGK